MSTSLECHCCVLVHVVDTGLWIARRAMAGSNLRNLVKKRTYRERAQPVYREHLGLLEKKKDYKLRANDFNRKKEALRKMREKAANKNPDEYYYGMAHTKMVDGIHQKRAAPQTGVDELAAFKTEDASYVRTKKAAEAKKIDRLRASLHMLDAPLQNRHTIFVSSAADAMGAELPTSRATPAEAAAVAPLSRKRHRVASDEPDGGDDGPVEGHDVGGGGQPPPARTKKAQKQLDRLKREQYDELEQRVQRHEKMGKVLQRLGMERAMMGKGARKRVGPKGDREAGAPKQFKWKQRRQR